MSGEKTSGGEFRVEHDSMGEVRVPSRALWRKSRRLCITLDLPIPFWPTSTDTPRRAR